VEPFTWIMIALFLIQLAMMATGYLLFRPTRTTPTKSPLAEFKMSAVKVGASIPVVWGIAKIGGLIIEWGDWKVTAHKKTQQGK
jgi:hypothetical protein